MSNKLSEKQVEEVKQMKAELEFLKFILMKMQQGWKVTVCNFDTKEVEFIRDDYYYMNFYDRKIHYISKKYINMQECKDLTKIVSINNEVV